MRGSSLGYLLKEGSRNVWVNRLMSLASIGILTACMLLIGISVLMSVNMNSIVNFVENQNEFVVFMDTEVDSDTLAAFDAEMKQIENIKEIQFISREEVLQQEKDKVGEAIDLLHEGDNPYPDTYSIKVKNLAQLTQTVEQVQVLDGVDSINAPTDIASTLLSIRQIVFVMGMSIIVLLIAVSLMIIANTIKITVFNRRKEISIMKYVGATDIFIRLPFMIEGLILGLVSAILAYFILWGGYSYLITWVAENPSAWIQSVNGSIIPFRALGLQLFGGFAAGGVGLGVVGSMVFVRSYLRV